MVHSSHSFISPIGCHPERSDRRFRPGRKGSAFLSSLSAPSSAFSVNGACPDPVGALRKTRALTPTDPSATLCPIATSHFQSSSVDSPSPSPFLGTPYSSLTAIPFRIISFADRHPLTLIESHLYKKQGRGCDIRGSPALPLFFTTSKQPTLSNARNPNIFMRLLHSFLDTKGSHPSNQILI
jgi:hypothetical protein